MTPRESQASTYEQRLGIQEQDGRVPRCSPHVPGEAGVWVLILGEMVIFGIFFAIFSYDYARNWQLFSRSQQTLNNTIGLVNTILLLLSSLLVVQGVQAVRDRNPQRASSFFGFALLCGLGFATNKILEHGEKLSVGITPKTNDFYMYYYIFTGVHAFHLVIGMCVLTFLWRATRKRSHIPNIALIEGCASYWHLVDVLWIVLFPLLYLV